MSYQGNPSAYNAYPPITQDHAATVELPAPGDPTQPVELPAAGEGYSVGSHVQFPSNEMPVNLPPGFRIVYDPSYQKDSSPSQLHQSINTNTETPRTEARSIPSPVPIHRENDTSVAGAATVSSRPDLPPPSYEAATSTLHLEHTVTGASRASVSSQTGSQSNWSAGPQLSPQPSYQSGYGTGPKLSPQTSHQSTYFGNADAGPSPNHPAYPGDQDRQPSAEYQPMDPQSPFRSPPAGYQMTNPSSGFPYSGAGYQRTHPPIPSSNTQPNQYMSYAGQPNAAFQTQCQTTYTNVSPSATQAILQDVFSNLQISPSSSATHPPSINLAAIQVPEGPVYHSVTTHNHALKALKHCPQSTPELRDILGQYLRVKHDHEYSHNAGNRQSHHSRPEIKVYNDLMQKLEDLSGDYIAKEKGVPRCWPEAIGPHRRYLFAELYNQNDLVRGFCNELRNGPLELPRLDEYALGITHKNFNPSRAPIREANFAAPFEILGRVRTVFLIDDSGSMNEPGHSAWGGIGDSRWAQAQRMVAEIAPLVAAYNPLGVDLHFLNRGAWYGGLTTVQRVNQAFQADWPNAGTPTGQRVHDIIDSYMAALRHFRGLLMPLNLIVVTDGEAQDEGLLHWSIEEHVTKNVHRGFPAHQFGIEFIQVGDCRHATRHLVHLEEEVSRHHHKFQRDVVGVTPVTKQMGRMGPQEILGIAVSGVDARMNGYLRARRVNV